LLDINFGLIGLLHFLKKESSEKHNLVGFLYFVVLMNNLLFAIFALHITSKEEEERENNILKIYFYFSFVDSRSSNQFIRNYLW